MLRRMSAARLGVLLHEQAVGGAARQRLQPERAGAGEQVEHAHAVEREIGDAVRQDVEHRLAHAVGGGARAVVRRRGERRGRGTGRRRSSCPALGLGRRLGACAEAALPRSSSRDAQLGRRPARRAARAARAPSPARPRPASGRAAGTARTRCGSAGSRRGPGGPGSCAPRGSCPRAGRCVSQTLVPCGLVERGLDGAVAHAVDLDAVLQLVERVLRDRCRARARGSAASSRWPAAPGGGRARRRW